MKLLLIGQTRMLPSKEVPNVLAYFAEAQVFTKTNFIVQVLGDSFSWYQGYITFFSFSIAPGE